MRLPFHCDMRALNRRSHWMPLLSSLQPIVAIVPWIALTPITCRKNNVDHFASGRKVESFVSLLRTFDEFAQKLAHWLSQNSRRLRGIHAVTMKLDNER